MIRLTDTELALLWAVGENPDDDLPRGAFADELDANARSATCPNPGCYRGMSERHTWVPPEVTGDKCPVCSGSGTVPDGRAAWAELIREIDLEGWKSDSAERSLSPQGITRHAALRLRQRNLIEGMRFDLGAGYWATASKGFNEDGTLLSIFPPGGASQIGSGRVRRGFVESVSLPMAAFLGDPCTLCDGEGHIDLGVMGGYPTPEITNRVKCSSCKGSGRVGGCAAELFTRHPVTSVRLTDKEPADTRGQHGGSRVFTWFAEDAFDDQQPPRRLVNVQHAIPRAIPLFHDGQRRRNYSTAVLAHAALSAALVTYGRTLARTARLAPAAAG